MSSSSDNSRHVPWPPPSPGRPEDWQQQQAQHYGQPYAQQQPRVKLTPEEVAVLQKCSQESFWYRCVPLAFGAVIATQTLVNRGIWKPNPRFGSLFKNMAAATVAYLIGKVSYQGECRKKIMAMENSPLAEAMRSGKRGRELFQEMAMLPSSGESTTPADDPAAKYAQRSTAGSHLDIDAESAKYTELDEGHRPTLDGTEVRQRRDDQNQSYVNYADLRAQNRVEYERKNIASQLPTRPPPQVSPSIDRPLPPPPPSSDMYSGIGSGSLETPPRRPQNSQGQRLNKYGDVISDD